MPLPYCSAELILSIAWYTRVGCFQEAVYKIQFHLTLVFFVVHLRVHLIHQFCAIMAKYGIDVEIDVYTNLSLHNISFSALVSNLVLD